MNKYEIVKTESIEHNGRTLYRIRALREFLVTATNRRILVKAGDLGGYIEKEENLSQEGECWIADEAKVYDNAEVKGSSLVYGYAEVFENAVICNAFVYDNAKVFGNVIVCALSQIFGNAKVSCFLVHRGNISGNAEVYDKAKILGGFVSGDAKVYDNAIIHNSSMVCENAEVFGSAFTSGSSYIKGSAKVYDNAAVLSHDIDQEMHVSGDTVLA